MSEEKKSPPPLSTAPPDAAEIVFTVSYELRDVKRRLWQMTPLLLPAIALLVFSLQPGHVTLDATGVMLLRVGALCLLVLARVVWNRAKPYHEEPELIQATAKGLWFTREKLFVPYERLLEIRRIRGFCARGPNGTWLGFKIDAAGTSPEALEDSLSFRQKLALSGKGNVIELRTLNIMRLEQHSAVIIDEIEKLKAARLGTTARPETADAGPAP
ncbi:MAG: hypothetical protein GC185_02810 [Alphaproteobacteria bacterium]|nr:hypothetical protein [Alphaproteobacteria bacterium]